MGKFTKGQWVRRVSGTSFTTESGRHENGFIGQIEEVVANGLGELIFTNGHRGIADSYESWQPKVGDRVTTNGNTIINIEKHWNEHFRRSGGDIVDGALVVTSVADHSGSNVGLSNKAGRAYFFMPASTLKPAAAASLSIDAGKFYKTRGGRKVGPIEAFSGGGLSRSSFGQVAAFLAPDLQEARIGGSYTSDGTWLTSNGNSHLDLIAEWVDEPAVAVAASNDNATKPKFKVGDRVNYTLTRSDWQDMVITEVKDDIFYAIKNNGVSGGFREDWLELVTAPTNPAIVALIENGQPRPSVKPYVHVDEASASKEAARLANKHKGQSFGVYVLTQTVKEDVVYTYKHEWQRLAANGDKIPAIKALREITGFSLKATKDAVEYWIANDQQYSRVAA